MCMSHVQLEDCAPVTGRGFDPEEGALFLARPFFLGPAPLALPLDTCDFGALGLRCLPGLAALAFGWQPLSVHAWQNQSPCACMAPTQQRFFAGCCGWPGTLLDLPCPRPEACTRLDKTLALYMHFMHCGQQSKITKQCGIYEREIVTGTHLWNGFQADACEMHSDGAGIAAEQVAAFAADCTGSRMPVLAPLFIIHQGAKFLLSNGEMR